MNRKFGRLFTNIDDVMMWTLSTKLSRQLFFVASRVGRTQWLALIFLTHALCIIQIVTYANPLLTLLLILLFVYIFFFFGVSLQYCLNFEKPLICEISESKTLSVHIGQDLPYIDESLVSICDVTQKLGYSKIKLWSPLFSNEEKTRIWVRGIKRRIRKRYPGAKVQIDGRENIFGKYATYRFLSRFEHSARLQDRLTVVNGRITAYCIVIELNNGKSS